MTTTIIVPTVITGETPTLSPFAQASPSDLDMQHELWQFLTPNPVAEFIASLFEIHRSGVHLLDAVLFRSSEFLPTRMTEVPCD